MVYLVDPREDGEGSEEGSRPEHMDEQLEAVKIHLAEFLMTYGLELFRSERGRGFDPRFMQPIKIIPTSEKTKDRTVVQSLQSGLRRGEQILRHERVAIYRFVSTITETQSAKEIKS